MSAYAQIDPAAITQAAGTTALLVAALGASGYATARDLTGWLRPLSYAVFALLVVSLLDLFSSD